MAKFNVRFSVRYAFDEVVSAKTAEEAKHKLLDLVSASPMLSEPGWAGEFNPLQERVEEELACMVDELPDELGAYVVVETVTKATKAQIEDSKELYRKVSNEA